MSESIERVPIIYLETSTFNFPFADDAPQYKADTLRLLEEIAAGKFKPIISEYVRAELEKTKEAAKREAMLALIKEYDVQVLPAEERIKALAEVYVNAGIIPRKFLTDAIHIAAATIYGADYIVSLNFKHIVKHKTIFETEVINTRAGYKRIFIHSPGEIIHVD